MKGNLERIAIVTGATAGIGAAAARRLLDAGWAVVGTGRRDHRLRQMARESAEGQGAFLGVEGDVSDPDLVAKLAWEAVERWGRPPSAFVLAAGRGLPGSLLNSDVGLWQELIQVNYVSMAHQLRASAFVLREGSPQSKPSGPKDIIVIGSTVGRDVSASNPVYGSTKFAVHALVESLRRELSPAGIRVTLIEPGFVKSEFQQVAKYDREWFEGIEQASGPLLEPDDVAEVIEFVLDQPWHVHLDNIRIRPTRQAI